MATSPLTLDLFDQWTASAAPKAAPASTPQPQVAEAEADADADAPQTLAQTRATPANLRRAIQELLKCGWLEQQSKPQLFRHLATELARANALLEPLDLEVRMDDTRGLAYVAIPSDFQGEDGQEDEIG